MSLSAATIWWVLAGILVAVELLVGTFYLLMLALGLAAGAVAAHLGLPLSAQVTTAAIVGGGAIRANVPAATSSRCSPSAATTRSKTNTPTRCKQP